MTWCGPDLAHFYVLFFVLYILLVISSIILNKQQLIQYFSTKTNEVWRCIIKSEI